MNELTWLTGISLGVGIILAVYNIVIARKRVKEMSPENKLAIFEKKTDDRLSKDLQRITILEHEVLRMKELERLTLRSLKGVLECLSRIDGNSEIHNITSEIDRFLIER